MSTASKEQIIQDLSQRFQETIDWINAQPEENFNKELVEGKWTIAGHLYHLVKSTKAVSQGMKMPKLVLKSMFGTNNREERTLDELQAKYKAALLKASPGVSSDYQAEPGREFVREKLTLRFQAELEALIKSIQKWDEEALGKYIMPHPLLGKCTLREFIYFTTFHTEHHLQTLKEKYHSEAS